MGTGERDRRLAGRADEDCALQLLPTLLAREEGKTLEFKENGRPLDKIVRTVVAFANTAGGILLVGVRDRTKEVVGLADALAEEQRLANAIAEGIRPVLLPDLTVLAWRGREVVAVHVPHAIGPYYIRSEGPSAGVYVRLGSSNRRAGADLVAEIERLARNTCFDEQPCIQTNSEAIDFRAASESFARVGRTLDAPRARSLGWLVSRSGREHATVGAVLLFGRERSRLFPDSAIRCARFAGTDRARIEDQTLVDESLPLAIERTLVFVARSTRQALEVRGPYSTTVSTYPSIALREALVNAVVHADYSGSGAGVRVAVFDDRVELSNPGALPPGMTLDAALAGVSRLRNRVIGRAFRELGLIEQWGSGFARMFASCAEADLPAPRVEEVGYGFRVVLFGQAARQEPARPWVATLLTRLRTAGAVRPVEAASLWQVSGRSARTRLRALVEEGLLSEIGTSARDPRRVYILRNASRGHAVGGIAAGDPPQVTPSGR